MSETVQELTPSEVAVMLLAAGRGKRMQQLTVDTPKPLLKVGEHSLIEHHLIRLAKLGFPSVAINIAYLGDKIRQALGDGSRFNIRINYSDESESGALETAGGIRHALPLLKQPQLLVINADIWTDFDFSKLLRKRPVAAARLVMVENPEHNPQGDFWVNKSGQLSTEANAGARRLTFSGIALYQTDLFTNLPVGKLALAPLLSQWANQGKVAALEHNGQWTDVGTPERLASLAG